ncbi:hypothetical protein Strvi_2453 [Streptomyces violaceusniger Tu 4113]|uniref:Uncharacterized protein n=1 Tax=Streptomyces violaceusniger (strain Tu 4113) TaxID=653045 RepID=G2P2Q1_STRV4|nr:hypothetical protein Strvi_2453 [Streptomyces violaceusniger Tu 4113]
MEISFLIHDVYGIGSTIRAFDGAGDGGGERA